MRHPSFTGKKAAESLLDDFAVLLKPADEIPNRLNNAVKETLNLV